MTCSSDCGARSLSFTATPFWGSFLSGLVSRVRLPMPPAARCCSEVSLWRISRMVAVIGPAVVSSEMASPTAISPRSIVPMASMRSVPAFLVGGGSVSSSIAGALSQLREPSIT